MTRHFLDSRSLSNGRLTLGCDQLALTKNLTIVALPPLTEGRSINLHNGTSDESLGAHQLIIAGIIDDVNETSLASDGLTTPAEVAAIQAKGTVFKIAATDANQVDALGTGQLGVSGLATQLELALLAVMSTLGAGRRTLVTTITTDTYS